MKRASIRVKSIIEHGNENFMRKMSLKPKVSLTKSISTIKEENISEDSKSEKSSHSSFSVP